MSYPQQKFLCTRFKPGSFWAKKRAKISSVAILQQLDSMKSTGRYDAFRLKWQSVYDDEADAWPVPMHAFWDSDVAKWIEGACYFLAQEQKDQEGEDTQAKTEHAAATSTVRQAVDELVDMIAAAQQPDGYLNVHFTVVDPKGRFKNLRDQHELYNAGHLIEAALAHEQLYGNDKLLKPLLKYVDLLFQVFGPSPGQKPGYPGHPETELALLRLFDKTGDSKHLELGKFFLTERGNSHGVEGKHYYDYEADQRGEGPHEVADAVPLHRSYWYQQAHVPLVEQHTIEGHSVRAAYLLTGLADLVRIQGQELDKSYATALHRLWDNMVDKKMYVTGGIGSMRQWEGFGIDYFLPQGTDEGGCYAETCASIGVMMLASRMLEMDRNGKYGDILELLLYNAVLTGVAIDGKSWTYVNQLASSDSDPSRRSEWFAVSCCPPNVLRLMGALGGYFYSTRVDGAKIDLTLHLYANMEITETVQGQQVKIAIETTWPLDGNVVVKVTCPESIELNIFYRVPNWCPKEMHALDNLISKPANGYAQMDANSLRSGSTFALKFPMTVRCISPHPFTGQSTIALQRGPIVYCVEDADNDWVDDHFKRTYVSANPKKISTERKSDPHTGEEYVAIAVDYEKPTQLDVENLGIFGPAHDIQCGTPSSSLLHGTRTLHYVPYYLRANRGGRGHMRVGLQSLDGLRSL